MKFPAFTAWLKSGDVGAFGVLMAWRIREDCPADAALSTRYLPWANVRE